MQISIGIVIAFIVVLLLLMLAGLVVIIYLLGKRSARNNPNNALILALHGNNIDKVYKGKLTESTKKGLLFAYDKDKSIIVPKEYKEIYIKNRRLVFMSYTGQLIATPFKEVGDRDLNKTEQSNLIYEMCSTHIGADAMRALKGKMGGSVMLFLIIAFIAGIACSYIFSYMNDKRQETTAPQTQQQQIQQPQTQQRLIEGGK